jgi:large subunit ribosomal protein L15
MALKNRKIQRKRGSRTCGYGNAKKHRGAGSRGGRGKAGTTKHKQIATRMKDPNYCGKIGFSRHKSISKRAKALNLSDIERVFDKWLGKGAIKKDKEVYVLDITSLGYDKVLGGGRVNHKLQITSESFSKSARKKIEEAGGKAITKE